ARSRHRQATAGCSRRTRSQGTALRQARVRNHESRFRGHDGARLLGNGRLGRRYSRAHVRDVLEERYKKSPVEDWETSDFHCRELAADLYLLTYTLVLDGRRTRRATIWQRASDGWKIVYHQGTVVQ